MFALNCAVHGPSQLFFAAGLLSCSERQSRERDDVVARSDRKPAASAGSLVSAGSATNARSLARPSPFMSLPTIGVNGRPELVLPYSDTANHGCAKPADSVTS